MRAPTTETHLIQYKIGTAGVRRDQEGQQGSTDADGKTNGKTVGIFMTTQRTIQFDDIGSPDGLKVRQDVEDELKAAEDARHGPYSGHTT